jgi:tetratricopeptide (TPR) repeat protein
VLALALLFAGSAAVDCSAAVTQGQRAEAAALFQEGQQALLDSRWGDAEGPLAGALALDPSHALAHYGLGQAYMGLRRYPDAVAAFSRSREAFLCASGPGRLDDQISALRDAIRRFERNRVQEGGAAWRAVNGDTSTKGDTLVAAHELERRLDEMARAKKSADRRAARRHVGARHRALPGGLARRRGARIPRRAGRRPALGRRAQQPRSRADAHPARGRSEREVKAAEKAGVPVNRRLIDEIRKRKRP